MLILKVCLWSLILADTLCQLLALSRSIAVIGTTWWVPPIELTCNDTRQARPSYYHDNDTKREVPFWQGTTMTPRVRFRCHITMTTTPCVRFHRDIIMTTPHVRFYRHITMATSHVNGFNNTPPPQLITMTTKPRISFRRDITMTTPCVRFRRHITMTTTPRVRF